MKHLNNKNAIITGGSDGIGLAIAKELASQGANILLIGRNKNRLETVSKELEPLGGKVEFLSADLSDIEGIKNLAENILTIFPKIDILVNNAGMGRFVSFEEMDLNLLDMHINLNVKAPYLLTKCLYPSLQENKGNILNISSYFADRMLPGRKSTAYSLTKGALNSFTKSLAFEVGKDGVRVNAIAPGSITTNLFTSNMNKLSESAQQSFNELVKVIYPMQKIGEPEDIAKMASFLVSDQAKWITGSIVSVDGGLTTN